MTCHIRSLREGPGPDLFDATRVAPSADGAARSRDAGLLEALLAGCVPPARAGVLAERLIAAFGDLGRVVSAPPERLRSVLGWDGAVADHIKAAEAIACRMARAETEDRPVLSTWDALMRYLQVSLSHHAVERARVLYLDRRNALVAEEEAGSGTVDHVSVYPREILRRALDLDATALILVHNHPTGDPTPSDEDVALTHALRDACDALGLTLHDHVVVGRGRQASYPGDGASLTARWRAMGRHPTAALLTFPDRNTGRTAP